MTQSRFFQVSLTFPFILWCIGLLLFSMGHAGDHDLVMKNLTNGYRVFVPYLVFAAALWKKADRKPYRLLVPMAFAVPIAWGFFFTLWYVAASYITERTVDKWHVLCMMVFWAALVAYVVEIIPFLILSIFKDDFKSDS